MRLRNNNSALKRLLCKNRPQYPGRFLYSIVLYVLILGQYEEKGRLTNDTERQEAAYAHSLTKHGQVCNLPTYAE